MTNTRRKGAAAVLMAALLIVGACSSDDSGDDTRPANETTGPDDTTTTTAAEAAGVDAERVQGVVEALADDELEGRDNHTDGSVLAQDLLVDQLSQISEPLDGDTLDGYGHTFSEGTNLIGQIPGSDRADEYVVLGAHYDHLGHDCRTDTPGDDICNGAADNASGVATVLEVGHLLAADSEPPSRTIILAFWDAEEDDLGGSRDYVTDPPVPLEDTVAYLNWDIQGANLSPALADTTVVVGAETGGPGLVAATQAATESSPLSTLQLSLLFGQGRSDHANFASAGVPIVFFTDANTPCYHTAQDDVSNLDFDKLDQQILTAEALTRDLASTEDVPVYDPTAPPATYDDAVSMLGVVSAAEPDFGLFSPEAQDTAAQFLTHLNTMVDAGAEAFDDAAVSTLLGGSIDIVEALSTGVCDGFLD